MTDNIVTVLYDKLYLNQILPKTTELNPCACCIDKPCFKKLIKKMKSNKLL